jgi:hypothetical protein
MNFVRQDRNGNLALIGFVCAFDAHRGVWCSIAQTHTQASAKRFGLIFMDIRETAGEYIRRRLTQPSPIPCAPIKLSLNEREFSLRRSLTSRSQVSLPTFSMKARRVPKSPLYPSLKFAEARDSA